VGRLCFWDNLFPPAQLARSRYERVLIRAIAGQQLRLGGRTLQPVGMEGWSAVAFRDENGRRQVIGIDDLVQHLDAWEGADRTKGPPARRSSARRRNRLTPRKRSV
jgi:hypothetical protein